MNTRLLAASLAVFASSIFASPTFPQGRVHFAFAQASPRVTSATHSSARTNFARMRRVRRYFDGSGFLSSFYPDYDYDYDGEMIGAPPQQFIAQTIPSVSAPPNPPESLLLELQGDHWVRITNYGQSQTAEVVQTDFTPATKQTISRKTQSSSPPIELPLAVLVFRDGHQEEIGKYVIVGKTLYTNADYWSSGSWTRQIQIVALDVPTTLKLNQQRGTKFSLPSSPNEVMMRP